MVFKLTLNITSGIPKFPLVSIYGDTTHHVTMNLLWQSCSLRNVEKDLAELEFPSFSDSHLSKFLVIVFGTTQTYKECIFLVA
jgi:hypothetical protein